MSLTKLSNDLLISRFKDLRKEEQRVLVEILHHIKEMERRKLHLEKGHTGLYSYLVKEFGYSEHEAFTRIEASRLITAMPEFEKPIEQGLLSLSSVAEVRSAIRQEEGRTGVKFDRTEQSAVVESVIGLSRRETQNKLADRFPEFKAGFKEKLTNTRDGGWIVEIFFNRKQRTDLEQAKNILANAGPLNSFASVISKLAENYLRKKDLTQHLFPGEETVHQEKSVPTLRISMGLRRAIFRRDKGLCQFKNSEGRICGSRFRVELDHIIPVSAGGKSSYPNLRCLCRAHNQWKSDKPEPRPQTGSPPNAQP